MVAGCILLPAGDACIAERPFSDASPGFLEIADGQVDQFGCGIISWKAAAGFRCFSDHPIEAFDGVGRIDRFSDILRVVEQGVQIVPMGAP